MTDSLIPGNFKDEFWTVVADCLQEFHGLDQLSCAFKVRRFRSDVDQWPESRQELFYHGEPFEVACNLAGNRLDLKKYVKRYLAIRDERHGTGIADQFHQYRSAKTP